jgi:hypothetical protein
MRLWDAHRTAPRRFYHCFLVGKIVRRSLTRVSRNVAGRMPIQIILLSPLVAENLLPPARKLPMLYLDRVVPNKALFVINRVVTHI